MATKSKKTQAPKIPQEFFDDAVVRLAAPHEAMWRKHAVPASRPKFIEERSRQGEKLAEDLLSFVHTKEWPSLDDCIPRGTILDAVDRYFVEFTDIPRELPFFTVLHYLSTLMLQQGVQIERPDKTIILPDLWTLLLASSGGGKSMTQNAISKALGGPIKRFPEFASAAKFMENLATDNRSLYLRDEFAQLLRGVRVDPKMEGLRDYLLQAYNNEPLSRPVKGSTITVDQPALSILGFTATKTITTAITGDMLDDGFAQRFGYCFAEREAGRQRVADYDWSGLAPAVQPLWQEITKAPFHKTYHLDQVGRSVYQRAFELLADRADELGMDESYTRRVLWRAYKYALLYHVLNGKTDPDLHADDVAFGARLCAINIRDSARLLGMFGRLRPALATDAGPGSVVGNFAAAQAGGVAPQQADWDKDIETARKLVQRLGPAGKIVNRRVLSAYVKKGAPYASSLLQQLAQDTALSIYIDPK